MSKTNRIGAMAPVRSRTTDCPTYQQLLLKHGLLARGASSDQAWGLWQRVCEDPKIKSLSQEIERPKHRLGSATAGYLFFGQALTMLSDRQMLALKKRLGIQWQLQITESEREYR